jgi:hypothetical protein
MAHLAYEKPPHRQIRGLECGHNYPLALVLQVQFPFISLAPYEDESSGIYGFEDSIQQYRRVLGEFGEDGKITLRFLDHLASLGLSTARICKYAGYTIVLLHMIDFDLRSATRVERYKREGSHANCGSYLNHVPMP